MIYLLDSNIIGYLVQENQTVGDHLNRLGRADRVVICTIVRGELLVTHDDDFRKIDELAVEDWTK
jgi:predicted nucleic acid-binding protein